MLLLGGNPLLASDVLLAWQAMRQSASAIHYFPPEKYNLYRCTFTRTCVGRFCDANYMNTKGVNLIRGTKYAESRFLYAAISRLFFHVEAVILGLENLLLSMLNSTHDNVINPTTGYR